MYAGRHMGRACDKHDPFRVEPDNNITSTILPFTSLVRRVQNSLFDLFSVLDSGRSLQFPSHTRHDTPVVLGMAQ